MISTLVQCAVEEDPSCARMLLAFERWILHPGPATAGELTDQAAAYSAAMDAPLQTRALTVGVCLDAAVDEVRSRGAWGAGPEAMAVIGAAAIDENGAMLDFDLAEVHVTRAMIQSAKHVILAADSSKFGRSAPVCIDQLGKVHTLVTDRFAAPALRALCQAHEVELVEAGPD